MSTTQIETYDEAMEALFGAELDSVINEIAAADPVRYVADPAMSPVASSVPCTVSITLIMMC